MTTRCAIVVAFLLAVPVSAGAQVNHPASVGGIVAATSMDSNTSLSFAGSFNYRFNSVVGLELEATWAPDLESPFPGASLAARGSLSSVVATDVPVRLGSTSVIQTFPAPTFMNVEGRAVIFSNNVRVSIPTTTARLEPYFVAGGGLASFRQTADFVYAGFAGVTPAPGLPNIPIPFPVPRTITQRVTSSSVDLALTLGGGLEVRVASQLSVDADLRVFRLMGDEDRNLGRFGVGVRYRF
jgi:opacity protein-like surface antigen